MSKSDLSRTCELVGVSTPTEGQREANLGTPHSVLGLGALDDLCPEGPATHCVRLSLKELTPTRTRTWRTSRTCAPSYSDLAVSGGGRGRSLDMGYGELGLTRGPPDSAFLSDWTRHATGLQSGNLFDDRSSFVELSSALFYSINPSRGTWRLRDNGTRTWNSDAGCGGDAAVRGADCRAAACRGAAPHGQWASTAAATGCARPRARSRSAGWAGCGTGGARVCAQGAHSCRSGVAGRLRLRLVVRS